jgi:hypothetical protein
VHHLAMPHSVLAAVISVALMWGWPRFAGLSMLAWIGLLRPIEFLGARRADLVLPVDLLQLGPPFFLQIQKPKTRNRAAAHQAARLDDVQAALLLTAIYGTANPDSFLWPNTPHQFRKCFDLIMEVLHVEGLTPASFRGGGATYLFEVTQDAPFVMRRGRWMSMRTMDIYLQELQAAMLLPRLSEIARMRIYTFASLSEHVTDKAISLLQHNVVPAAWPSFFAQWSQQDDDSASTVT